MHIGKILGMEGMKIWWRVHIQALKGSSKIALVFDMNNYSTT